MVEENKKKISNEKLTEIKAKSKAALKLQLDHQLTRAELALLVFTAKEEAGIDQGSGLTQDGEEVKRAKALPPSRPVTPTPAQ